MMPQNIKDEVLRYAMKNGIFAVLLTLCGWWFATQVYMPQQDRFNKFLDQQTIIMRDMSNGMEQQNKFHERQSIYMQEIFSRIVNKKIDAEDPIQN